MTHAERRAALEAIAVEVRKCTRCKLATGRTKAVPGEGSPDTEVVFVGEGPGMNEDRQGRPFVGRAGGVLMELLGSVEWRREDGAHFDPWVRLHERVGGEILAPAPQSMVIEAPVAEWEEWTAMTFPEDGSYVVPGMLAPLDVRDGVGVHVEPNIWLRHTV